MKHRRVYHLPDGDLLIEVSYAMSSHLSLDGEGRAQLTDGDWIEPRTFIQVDASGARRARFGGPSEYALDDYLYILGLYFVRDDALQCGGLELGGPIQRFSVRLMGAPDVVQPVEPADPADPAVTHALGSLTDD